MKNNMNFQDYSPSFRQREKKNEVKEGIPKIYFKLQINLHYFLFMPQVNYVLELNFREMCLWSCIFLWSQSLFSFQSDSLYPEGCWFNDTSECSSLNDIYSKLFLLKERFVIPIRNESLILAWHYIWNLPRSSQISSNSEESKVQQTKLM